MGLQSSHRNCSEPLSQLLFEDLLLAGIVPFPPNTQEQSPNDGLIKGTPVAWG